MPVIVRTLFSPAIYEVGRWEAIEMMIATLKSVILSLKAETTPLEPSVRQAAIDDVANQIAELEAYRETQGVENRHRPPPRHLE